MPGTEATNVFVLAEERKTMGRVREEPNVLGGGKGDAILFCCSMHRHLRIRKEREPNQDRREFCPYGTSPNDPGHGLQRGQSPDKLWRQDAGVRHNGNLQTITDSTGTTTYTWNARNQLTGITLRTIPFTPERVKAALA